MTHEDKAFYDSTPPCTRLHRLHLQLDTPMSGFFCRIPSLLQGSFAKETYHFKEPTNRRHPTLDCIDGVRDSTALTTSATKEPLIIGLFCRKSPLKKRHPMSFRHPELECMYCICDLTHACQTLDSINHIDGIRDSTTHQTDMKSMFIAKARVLRSCLYGT